jgi:DNA polymerase/3'-5' exonuclease PolX
MVTTIQQGSTLSSCWGLLPILKDDGNHHENPPDDGTTTNPLENDELVVLDPDQPSSNDGLIVGRMELLSMILNACACSDGEMPSRNIKGGGGEEETPNRCSGCRHTLQWARFALSRRLLKFTFAKNNGRRQLMVQARGTHAEVAVNRTNIILDPSRTMADDDWSQPPTQLRAGDTIEVCRRPCTDDNHGSDKGKERRLVFRVVKVRVESSSDRNDNSQQMLLPETQPLHRGESSKGSERLAKLQSSDRAVSDNSAAKQQQHHQQQQQSPPRLFFVPKGTDFVKRRREILASNLQRMGCTFVPDVMEAEYIVVSRSVTSLDRMAEACKVKRQDLEEHLRSKNVPLIVPRWADDCISQKLLQLPPGRKYAWPHFSTHRRFRSDENEHGQQDNKRLKSEHNQGQKPFPKNVKCADIFKHLSNLHKEMQLTDMDHWKSYCFRIVAGRLLHLDFEVGTDHDTMQRLKKIPGFGKGTLEKIEEILKTGTLERLRSFQDDPERMAMKSLTDVWGVGPSKAKVLMSMDYRDILDVRAGLRSNRGIQQMSLDRNQLVGVDCYEDILDRMPRSEVELIHAIVEKTAQRMHPGMEVTVQGSYRRGKETCGDVDIHLTHPSHTIRVPDRMLGQIIGKAKHDDSTFFHSFVCGKCLIILLCCLNADELWADGHIAFHLTVLNGMTKGLRTEDFERHAISVPPAAWRSTQPAKRYLVQDDHKSFWMGCFNSPMKKSIRRRVDIKLYPYRERAFATVYFTGNGFMNRSMRLWAKRVFNWRLSDHGLFDIATGKRVTEATTEREIFDHLKLVYKEPHERDSFDSLESKEGVLNDNMQLSEDEFKEESKYVWVN